MGRSSKCVVVGVKGIGKTTILEQLIYGNFETQVYNLNKSFLTSIEFDFLNKNH
jgi:GTPase SAR1 family protein